MPRKPDTHKPLRVKTSDPRQSACKRGYDARWRKVRAAYLMSHPVCVACKRAAACHVDHIIARERGGTDDESNLQALCHSCHSRKTCKVDGGFGR